MRILSEAIAGPPLHLYRYREDGERKKATDKNGAGILVESEENSQMSCYALGCLGFRINIIQVDNGAEFVNDDVRVDS